MNKGRTLKSNKRLADIYFNFSIILKCRKIDNLLLKQKEYIYKFMPFFIYKRCRKYFHLTCKYQIFAQKARANIARKTPHKK